MSDHSWIGVTFTSRRGWNHLETLVDVGDRMAGSDGERQAAEATRDALDDAGTRDAHLDEFEVQGWERGSSTITADEETVATERTWDCLALPRSPAGAVTGELVDVGYGLPEDFDADLDGKVVVCSSTVPDYYERFIHRREKYYRAVQAGAAAFVFENHVEGCLAPTGSVGTADAPIGESPAVGVSSELGARLRRRFEGEQVTVDVDCEYDTATSQNVHAVLGPDTDEEVLVTSHVDAHDIAEGAMDNGAGTAMVVELANALAMREDDLDTRVRFVAFGAEEVGLVGSEYDAERSDLDSVKAIVNCDGVLRGRSLTAFTHGFDDLDAVLRETAERFDHPIKTNPRQGPHSDHWPYVLEGGVPAYHVASESGERGRGWGHTRADTLDKLDVRDLREQAILLTDLTVRLADDGTTVARQSRSEIVDALEREDQAEGLRITGDLP
ncbi:M28 family peptidase [Halomarina oriensis]|uniref:Carboxypeptidase Q n=1 Tax=Halomarina oriensis TaxID=671145 RepID=A0A6B0GF48_9EURY|nr:M28 family metallopeptidase [Halomarina oriensis]MWG33314.1 M28 family peptidase [Halomarina oriensis]